MCAAPRLYYPTMNIQELIERIESERKLLLKQNEYHTSHLDQTVQSGRIGIIAGTALATTPFP